MAQSSAFVDQLALSYMRGKGFLVERGFAAEIDWQEDAIARATDEDSLLRECAWAILSCGLSERAVASVFPRISAAFFDWSSARAIVEQRSLVLALGAETFNHPGKLSGIADFAELVARIGPHKVVALLDSEPEAIQRAVPFLGPVSTQHLKKNLGFVVSKPDRHLVRLSTKLGMSVEQLCSVVANRTGDQIGVVDLVLWRLCERRAIDAIFSAEWPTDVSA